MDDNRRPIKSRSNAAIVALSSFLAGTRVTPNQISCASAVFAFIGALALLNPESIAAMVVAIVCIQLRLLCNVVDGLVAVEGGKKSIVGPIFNEFPDRVADSLLLVAAGVAAGMTWLGWAAALFAALTAYVRVFGGSVGVPQRFIGPMAKQHRMAVLTLACVATIVETLLQRHHVCLFIALIIIAVGSALTCVTRTRALVQDLHAQQNTEADHHA
ncbi:CDP-alcohol phosphatidyltransferase family protein [Paraburkholderia sp. Ac-20347]|jgi:phosphatidylglycerophosphate synthase|uniref:CDP-alcohol phosphatidyltransferase family protein n=1 Tax=Paraburkholderia sp. Ac-20347 TaxID=2703892 RepID=UPI00197FB7B3|nr:CDP-alcohol phosphatidyltransferase family protein [Paraburkholderia sp. Ac-20347]MBN3809481.1 CDP-alcohol phosphatidyltransferase family protein [Paraburkholderia sp. Ac-20347]